MNTTLKHVLLTLVGIAMAGCATNRGVLDLPPVAPTADTPELSETAPTVAIVKISDNRRFELKPSQPSTPSLKGGEIDNPAITNRAIARKRNSYGMALGDILLPEERTVMDVVRETLTATLTDKGYRVVDATSADHELTVDISEFWAWFTPGFWAAKVEFRANLGLQGSVPGIEDTTVGGYAHQRHQVVGGGAWLQTMGVGMDDLSAKLSQAVEPAK